MKATIGVDVGAIDTKAVVLGGDTRVLGRSLVHSSVPDAAGQAVAEALAASGLSRQAIAGMIATGVGDQDVAGATGTKTSTLCDALGTKRLVPSAGTVIDIGGEGSRAIKCDPQGRVAVCVRDNTCDAGTGGFLQHMSELLQVPVTDMGELSLKSTQEIDIDALCVVFAESDVISHIHMGVPREDILNGIHKSIARRLFILLNRVGVSQDVVAIGGLARNVGVVRWLEKMLGVGILVPEYPEFVGAVGAALVAAERS